MYKKYIIEIIKNIYLISHVALFLLDLYTKTIPEMGAEITDAFLLDYLLISDAKSRSRIHEHIISL